MISSGALSCCVRWRADKACPGPVVPFADFDISDTAIVDAASVPTASAGAVGYMSRVLTEYTSIQVDAIQ